MIIPISNSPSKPHLSTNVPTFSNQHSIVSSPDTFIKFSGKSSDLPPFIKVVPSKDHQREVDRTARIVHETWQKFPANFQSLFLKKDVEVAVCDISPNAASEPGFEGIATMQTRPYSPRCIGTHLNRLAIVIPAYVKTESNLGAPADSGKDVRQIPDAIWNKFKDDLIALPPHLLPYIITEEFTTALDPIAGHGTRPFRFTDGENYLGSEDPEFREAWAMDCRRLKVLASDLEKFVLDDAIHQPREAFAKSLVPFLIDVPLISKNEGAGRRAIHQRMGPSSGPVLLDSNQFTDIEKSLMPVWFPRVTRYMREKVIPQLEDINSKS